MVKCCFGGCEMKTLNRTFQKTTLVAGVGGAGTCILNHISHMFDQTVQFLVTDTNLKSLSRSVIKNQLQLGKNITKGQGCGGNTTIGKAAALESTEEILNYFEGVEMVVIIAGVGGGAGSAGTQVVAGIAKNMGLRVASILVFPFDHEFGREDQAKNTIEIMKSISDSVTVLYNSDLNHFKERVPELDLRSAFGWQDMRVYEEIKKVIEAL